MKGTRLTKDRGGEGILRRKKKKKEKQQTNPESELRTYQENRTESTVLCTAWVYILNISPKQYDQMAKKAQQQLKGIIKGCIMPQSNVYDKKKTK